MFPMNEQFADFFKNFQAANNPFADAFKNMVAANDQRPTSAQNLLSGNEQFKDTIKISLEAQADFFYGISANVFASAAKVVELNMSAAKVSVEESEVICKQLLASKTPQEFMALVAALPQPTSVKAAAYTRHLADITSSARAELARATDEQVAQSGRKLSAMVDEITKGLPAGSENAVAMATSMIANGHSSYEQFNKQSQEAIQVMEANITNAVNRVSEFSGKAATATGRKT